jgi:hypothetical protein
METSDTSLFTSIIGTMLSKGDFESLGVKMDGERVELKGRSDQDVAAHLIWVQLLARMEIRPDVAYWRGLVADLKERPDQHREAIRRQLEEMSDRLSGLQYERRTIWSHIEEVADDPLTVVGINAPTYMAGYETFFDTKGRLTWDQPEYDVFDPDIGIPRIVEMMEGKAALLLCQQQKEPGRSAHRQPVFARHLSLGQYVYLNSNRPDEIFEITGGPKVAIRKMTDITTGELPMIPYDYEIKPDSRITLTNIKASVADFYRNLWMHRLAAVPGSANVLMAVDGYAAGVFAYNTGSMSASYNVGTRWERSIILRFSFGAPHESYRLTRLSTQVALRKQSAEVGIPGQEAFYLAASTGLVTIEYTRHPEAKGLRSLMKLVNRTIHPDGFRLIYAADWNTMTLPDIVTDFLRKEESWQKSRQKAS